MVLSIITTVYYENFHFALLGMESGVLLGKHSATELQPRPLFKSFHFKMFLHGKKKPFSSESVSLKRSLGQNSRVEPASQSSKRAGLHTCPALWPSVSVTLPKYRNLRGAFPSVFFTQFLTSEIYLLLVMVDALSSLLNAASLRECF